MKRSDSISILGAGGHAKVVVSTLLDMGCKVDFLYDDDVVKCDQHIFDIIIRSPLSRIQEETVDFAVIAVGGNELRKKIALKFPNIRWAVAVHPSAYVHPSAKIGCGSVVFAGAIIQPGAVIGEHCIINTGALIDHDCIIGDFVHVGPGVKLAGNVKVGNKTFLGIGSVVIPGMRIGSSSTIGAGSVVIKDIPGSVTAYGVPAVMKSE